MRETTVVVGTPDRARRTSLGSRAIGQAGDGAGGGPGDGERGAGSILAVALIATVLALFSLLTPLGVVLEARHRAAGAADASALAAMDVALGIVAGVPCEEAASVASANGATLDRCGIESDSATVRVRVTVLGLVVLAQATAGRPGDGP